MIEWQALFGSPVNIAILILILFALGFSVLKLNQRVAEKTILYRSFFTVLHSIVSLCFLCLLLQPSFKIKDPVSATLYIVGGQLPPPKLSDHEYIYFSEENSSNSPVLNPLYLARYRNQIIHQPEQLLLKKPGLTHLMLVGDGLLPSQLNLFHDQVLSFQANPLVTGVINPQWNDTLDAGANLEFSAIFQSNDQSIYQVRLFNPADQIEDETSVINGDRLTLQANPKIAGTHMFRLIISDQYQNNISEQLIPLIVTEPKRAKILVMQSSPSFESKQLQNWAAEFGAELLIRTRMSKNKFTTHSINLSRPPKIQPESLVNLDSLSLFDVLVIDGRELEFLDNQQQGILSEAIKNGLGFVVRADGSFNSDNKRDLPKLLSTFNITPLNQNVRVDLIMHHQLDNQFVFADSVQLSAAPLHNIKQTSDIATPLIVTPQGHVVVARKHHGLGKVAVSVIKHSYQLRTADQAKAYSSLWSHIIKHTARTYDSSHLNIESEQAILTQNFKIKICLSRSADIARAMQAVDSKLVPNNRSNQSIPAEIIALSSPKATARMAIDLIPVDKSERKFCGHFWPNYAGWHHVQNSELKRYFYVHSSQSWPAAKQNSTLSATQSRVSNWNPTITNPTSQKIISDWYYWLLIVVATSLIWIERKFWSTQ